MKRRLFVLALILIATLSFAQDEVPEGRIPSKLSKDTILIGDRVEWIMNLSIKEGEECYFEQPDDPVAGG
ncbi:MAG: hypothetical protein WC166_06920, partial [Bacteroidales bacterium]